MRKFKTKLTKHKNISVTTEMLNFLTIMPTMVTLSQF